jgi:peptide/nickel transport system substrate-binding protein
MNASSYKPIRGSKTRRRFLRFSPRIVAIVALSAASVAVPLTAAHAASSAAKPVLTVGIDQPPQSLNPALDDTGTNLIVHALSDETLIHINANGTYSPGLATSWKYLGSGNTTFEFTLRSDARFSDGSPVTAQAVKVWLNYFDHANGPFVSDFGPITSITTSGKWTVILHLGAANPDVPYFLSEALFNWGFVESPEAVAHPATLGTTTDGAGPYELVSSQTVAGSVYTFKPNPYYYDPSGIKWSKVVVKVISDPATMLSAAESGQLDVAQGDVSTASAAKAAGFNVLSAPDGTVHILFLDRAGTLDPALGNVEVRQALNMAINRAEITTALVGKYGTPTSEDITTDGFSSQYQNYYSYNPTKAKAMLTAAGYPNGFTFNVFEQNDLGTIGIPVMQAVAQQLAAIGVTMNLTTIEPSQVVPDLTGGQYAAWAVAGEAFPTWSTYSAYFAPTTFINPFKVADPTLGAVISQGATAANPSQDWINASHLVQEQGLFLPVFGYDTIFYVSKKVGGVNFTEKSDLPWPSEWFSK